MAIGYRKGSRQALGHDSYHCTNKCVVQILVDRDEVTLAPLVSIFATRMYLMFRRRSQGFVPDLRQIFKNRIPAYGEYLQWSAPYIDPLAAAAAIAFKTSRVFLSHLREKRLYPNLRR